MARDLSRAVWRTSTRSAGNGNCVEVADLGDAIALRDSKDRTGPALFIDPAGWSAFVDGTKDGSFTP